MAVHPLRPATDRRLGGPLPRQPANRTQAHRGAGFRPLVREACAPYTSFGISTPFGVLSPSPRQVAYALLTRLPLGFLSKLISPVRLACVKHAASVRPEPGSNSPYKISPLRFSA